jgi:hypothetical protein
MHLFVTDMCAQTQYLFFSIFVRFHSSSFWFLLNLFIFTIHCSYSFFFCFLKNSRNSLYFVCLFIPCLLYSLFFWLLCYYGDDDYFFSFTGRKKETKKWILKKKWIRKITEFELFRAIAPTPFPFFFIFFYLFFPPLTGWDRDGDVINCGGHIIGIEAVCVCAGNTLCSS